MYNVSQLYRDELYNEGNLHHIRGTLTMLSGDVLDLDDSTLRSDIRFEKRCTENEESFAIGQLYTGTVSFTLISDDLRRDELRGGEIYLEFAAGSSEYIPLGLWTVTEPERTDSHTISVTGADCINKLDVLISDNTVGAIKPAARLRMVTRLTGVEFAQTVDELCELSGIDLYNRWGTTFASTCRQEVAFLAQLMGCIAYADRAGRIVFRRIGTASVLTIPATLRHSVRLNEYSYGIRGVQYTDSYGRSEAVQWERTPEPNTQATVIIPTGNIYVWDSENPNEKYRLWLDPVAAVLNTVPDWTPGECVFYGDPALDLGDIVTLTGGINGNTSVQFLITGISWQFRGPQTLTSAGAGDGVSSGTVSAGSSGTSSAMTTINVTKSIACVDLESYDEELSAVQLTAVAEGMFSARSQTVAFAELTVNLTGTESGDVRIHLLLDGVKQTIHAVETIGAGEQRTVSYTVPMHVSQGDHTVSVEADGKAVINRITASVWGQDITGELSGQTYDDDYLYRDDVVTKYIGDSLRPRIPVQLGGNDVHVLADGSFTHSEVEYTYIPEGVTTIE